MVLLVMITTKTQAQASAGDRFNSGLDSLQEEIEDLWPEDVKLTDFRLRFGVATGMVPDYTGSDNYRLRALPIVELRYRDKWRLYGTKLTLNTLKWGDLEAGPLINLRFGRSSSRNKALLGLGDIGTTLELGGFVRFRNDKMLVSADVRQALSEAQGRTVRFTVGHGFYKDGPLAIAFALRGKYLSRKAMQTNFGVTKIQSAKSVRGFDAFFTDAGMSELSVNIVGQYRLGKNIRALGLLSYGQLMGDAANSPIVTKGVGSKHQSLFGGAITYQF